MDKEKPKTPKIEYIMQITAITIIMLIGLYNLNQYYCLTIINDEFAYWANAAQMAGKDWTSLLNTGSFYSYGYSLLLVPLFGLNISMTIAYRIAIAINVFLLALSFLLTYWLSKQLFGRHSEVKSETNHVDHRILLIISLIVTLYTNNIFQLTVAWAETALYFTFWAIAVLIYRVILPVIKTNKKPQIIDIILLASASIYIYTIHNRAIGVTLAVFIIILLIYLKQPGNKEAKNRLLLCLIIMIFLFILASLFRQYTINNWYQTDISGGEIIDDNRIAINDYSGQIPKFKTTLTPQGLANLLFSITGKIYYQATATFLLIFLPVISIIGTTLKSLFTKTRRQTDKWDINKWLLLFCTAAYLLETGIAAIYKTDNIANLRATDVLYGRYAEFVIGPLLLFAFAMIILKNKLLKEVIIGAIIYIISAVSVAYQLLNVRSMFIGVNNATALHRFFTEFTSPLLVTLTMSFIGLGGFILIIGCVLLKHVEPSKKKKISHPNRAHIIMILSVICIIGLYWFVTGFNISRNWVNRNAAGARETMPPIEEAMAILPATTVIYYIIPPDDTLHNFIKIYQSLDPDRTIRLLSYKELDNYSADGNYVYISSRFELPDDEDFIYLATSDRMEIFTKKDSKIHHYWQNNKNKN